jgi:hypothetical protein
LGKEHEEILRRARQVQRRFVESFAAAAAKVRTGTNRRNTRHIISWRKSENYQMGKLVKVDGQYIEQLHDEVAELAGNGFGALLKFDWETKKYKVGDTEVPLARELIAHCDQYARGWVKFVDKVLADVKVKKVSEGKPPERHELDESELADTEDDPWVFQRYLPLEDPETGEVLVFVTKSTGGKIALGDLLRIFENNWDRGLPVVRTAIGSFKTREYGVKPRPSFPIVRWTGDGQKVVANKEPGPPDREPSDPGYDLLDLTR